MSPTLFSFFLNKFINCSLINKHKNCSQFKIVFVIFISPPPAENVSRSAIEWDWDALISDEQEVTTPTTNLVVKHDKFYGESPWSCSVCFGAAPSFEDFTTHLKSVEHEFRVSISLSLDLCHFAICLKYVCQAGVGQAC